MAETAMVVKMTIDGKDVVDILRDKVAALEETGRARDAWRRRAVYLEERLQDKRMELAKLAEEAKYRELSPDDTLGYTYGAFGNNDPKHTLVMSAAELIALVDVLRKIGGSPEKTRRGLIDSVLDTLTAMRRRLGSFPKPPQDLEGSESIFFKEGGR